MSKHANLGKAAEKQVQAWLEARSVRDAAFAFHRFPDARAARGAMAAQPSDLLVVHRGVVTFLEVKECAHPVRIQRSKITQYGALKRMHWAGARVVVLVYRSLYDDWVFLDADDLFGADDAPASFKFSTDRVPSTPTAAANLERIFR